MAYFFFIASVLWAMYGIVYATDVGIPSAITVAAWAAILVCLIGVGGCSVVMSMRGWSISDSVFAISICLIILFSVKLIRNTQEKNRMYDKAIRDMQQINHEMDSALKVSRAKRVEVDSILKNQK